MQMTYKLSVPTSPTYDDKVYNIGKTEENLTIFVKLLEMALLVSFPGAFIHNIAEMNQVLRKRIKY